MSTEPQQQASSEVLPPIFFCIGGPGVGKGTVCTYLRDAFNLIHICAGDILRDEVKRGSDVGKNVIGPILAAGQVVPSEITIGLLYKRIHETLDESKQKQNKSVQGILLDGFPRKIDQSKMFEERSGKARAVIFFECPMEVMEKRLLARGREDDNLDVMKKRFAANLEQCVPVMEMFRSEGRLTLVDSSAAIDVVCKKCSDLFKGQFGLAVVDADAKVPEVPKL